MGGIACFLTAYLVTTLILLERYGGRSEDPWENAQRRDPRNAAMEIGLTLLFVLVPVAGIVAGVVAGREFGSGFGVAIGIAILMAGWYLFGLLIVRMTVIEGKDEP